MITTLVIALILAMYLLGWYAATANQLHRTVDEQRKFIREFMQWFDDDDDGDGEDEDEDEAFTPVGPDGVHRWN